MDVAFFHSNMTVEGGDGTEPRARIDRKETAIMPNGACGRACAAWLSVWAMTFAVSASFPWPDSSLYLHLIGQTTAITNKEARTFMSTRIIAVIVVAV
jgi:hypothetical protein